MYYELYTDRITTPNIVNSIIKPPSKPKAGNTTINKRSSITKCKQPVLSFILDKY